MRTDPGLKPTRDIRKRISRDLGNDPHRLIEYYMEYQRRFADRPSGFEPVSGILALTDAMKTVRQKESASPLTP